MGSAVRQLAQRSDQPEGWWADFEHDVLTCVGASGASPAQIAVSLDVSEAAVCSVISMLVEQGRIRISRVERV